MVFLPYHTSHVINKLASGNYYKLHSAELGCGGVTTFWGRKSEGFVRSPELLCGKNGQNAGKFEKMVQHLQLRNSAAKKLFLRITRHMFTQINYISILRVLGTNTILN